MKSSTKVLYLVSLAAFMRSFAQVIYSPSLVTIRDELETTLAMVGLTLSVYGLVLAFAQLAYGPIIDKYDGKIIVLGSMGLFALACLGGYFTQGISLLLLVRGMQALGIAAAASAGVALITDSFPASRRGHAMGVFEIFNAAGAAAGPAVGATIAVLFNWRADFLILSIIGLVLFILALWQLPPQPAHAQKVGLSDMFLIARTPVTAGALFLGLAHFYGLYTMHTLLPPLLTFNYGLGEGETGIMLTLLPIGAIAGASVGGRISDRIGSRLPLLVGALGTVFTFGMLAFLSASASFGSSVYLVGACVVLIGLSTGFGLPVQIKVMVEHFSTIRGTAGAMQYSARFLGSTLAPVLTGYLGEQFGLPAGFGSASVLLAVGAVLAFLLVHDPVPEPVV